MINIRPGPAAGIVAPKPAGNHIRPVKTNQNIVTLSAGIGQQPGADCGTVPHRAIIETQLFNTVRQGTGKRVENGQRPAIGKQNFQIIAGLRKFHLIRRETANGDIIYPQPACITNHVAAITGVIDIAITATAATEKIIARPAGQHVIAGKSDQRIIAGTGIRRQNRGANIGHGQHLTIGKGKFLDSIRRTARQTVDDSQTVRRIGEIDH